MGDVAHARRHSSTRMLFPYLLVNPRTPFPPNRITIQTVMQPSIQRHCITVAMGSVCMGKNTHGLPKVHCQVLSYQTHCLANNVIRFQSTWHGCSTVGHERWV